MIPGNDQALKTPTASFGEGEISGPINRSGAESNVESQLRYG